MPIILTLETSMYWLLRLEPLPDKSSTEPWSWALALVGGMDIFQALMASALQTHRLPQLHSQCLQEGCGQISASVCQQ